jgi:hypothetical protein
MPHDIATCIYYTGIDTFTKQEVYVARNLRDRKLQRALMQFFKPENYFEVRMALEQGGRPTSSAAAATPSSRPTRRRRPSRREGSRPMRRSVASITIQWRTLRTARRRTDGGCRAAATGLGGSRRSVGRG